MTLWHLELVRLTRTWRWTIVFGTYGLFGVFGPVTGRYLGEILEHFGGEMNVFISEPTPADGIARFIANASLLGRLAALVVGSDALAFDARSESAAFFRTRVDRARELLLPRYVVTTLTATLALIAGTVTAWTLTAVLIGPPPLLPVAVGTVYGVIHLAFAVAMLAAACGLTTNAASAVLLTFGVLALIPILGIVPSVKPWLPSELVAAVVFLLRGGPRLATSAAPPRQQRWPPSACSRSRSASTSVGSYDALTRGSRHPTFLTTAGASTTPRRFPCQLRRVHATLS